MQEDQSPQQEYQIYDPQNRETGAMIHRDVRGSAQADC